MTATIGPDRPTTHLTPTMLDLEDLQARYHIGRTKVLELVNHSGFLNSVVPGMHRYPAAALEAYDHAVALAGTPAGPARAVPPPRWSSRRRHRADPAPSPPPPRAGRWRGVEAASTVAVVATLDRRDRRLRQAVAGQPGQAGGDVFLGPTPPLPYRLDVVRDDCVDLHVSLAARRSGCSGSGGLLGTTSDHPASASSVLLQESSK